MSKELKFEDVEYNGKYGDIYAEVEPIITDESFDAYNGSGNLQIYGGYAVTGFRVLYATFMEVTEGGPESEIEISNEAAEKILETYEDSIIDTFSDYLEEY